MNARVMTRALIALGLLTALCVVSGAGRLSGVGAQVAAPPTHVEVHLAHTGSATNR